MVIYIHGIGDQPRHKALHRQWDLALFGREMGKQSRLCRWADIPHPEAGAPAAKSTRRGSKLESGADDFMRRLSARFETQKATADDGPRKKVLPLPGFLRRPMSELFLKLLVKDTAAYFFQPGVRAEVQRRPRKLLPPPGQPFVLVAHSQGTVAALETLASMPDDLRVLRFVTLCSPLGIEEIQDHLACPLIVPKNVERWHNFADRLDPVALDNALLGDFQPADRIEDEVITNTQGRTLIGFNPHSAVGYLAHPKVRGVVHRAIQFDCMARFVVARDVAESMAFDDRRHKVLIEILEPEYHALGEGRAEFARHPVPERFLLLENPTELELRLGAIPDQPVHWGIPRASRRVVSSARLEKFRNSSHRHGRGPAPGTFPDIDR